MPRPPYILARTLAGVAYWIVPMPTDQASRFIQYSDPAFFDE